MDDKAVHLLVNLQHIDYDHDKHGGCVYNIQVSKVRVGRVEAIQRVWGPDHDRRNSQSVGIFEGT